MRVPGRHRISEAIINVRKRFSRSATILLYHRVTELAADPQLLSVAPSRFAEQLEVLRRDASPLPLSELTSIMRDGRQLPRRAVAVTFDDGYADNYLEAKPLLERYDIPATVFVTSGQVGSPQEFWWDDLERLLLTGPDGANHAGWHIERPDDPTSQHERYRRLSEELRNAVDTVRQATLHRLAEQTGKGFQGRASHRAMTESEVLDLARSGLIEVGAHTVTHPVLSRADPLTQRNQIAGSKSDLERILGKPVSSFAYPYGGRQHYTRETVEIVRSLGFSRACSNFPGPVWRRTDTFQLPRMLIRNWGGDEFRRRLEL
jgi:peptidoglycan/xylan/chitin deacetylase (PgdA/CDA1 family)